MVEIWARRKIQTTNKIGKLKFKQKEKI